MEIEFSSLEELYKRLVPALDTKISDLKRNGIDYVKREDLWDYLSETRWKVASDLLLYEMVDDIINLDNTLIDNFVKNKLKVNR